MATIQEQITQQGINIKPDQPVSELVGSIVTSQTLLLYSMDETNTKLQGIFSPSKMLDPKIDITNEKASHFMKKVHVLSPQVDQEEAIRQIIANDTHFLPVFEKETFKGIVTLSDLMKPFVTDSNLAVKATDIAEQTEMYQQDTPLSEVYDTLRKKDIKHIPVRSDATNLKGYLDHRSIIRRLYWRDLNGERAPDLAAQANQEKPTQSDIMSMGIENFIADIQEIPRYSDNDFASEVLTKMLATGVNLAVSEDMQHYITMVNIAQHLVSQEPPSYNIQYSGLHDIDVPDMERERINSITHEFAEKYVHAVNNIVKIDMHVKQHQDEGDRKRYEVHTRATYPGATLAAEGENWEVIAAVRESLEGLEEQFRSKFKDSNQPTPSQAEIADDVAH